MCSVGLRARAATPAIEDLGACGANGGPRKSRRAAWPLSRLVSGPVRAGRRGRFVAGRERALGGLPDLGGGGAVDEAVDRAMRLGRRLVVELDAFLDEIARERRGAAVADGCRLRPL